MLRSLQALIIEELQVKPSVVPVEEARRRIDFLKDYARSSGASGFVLGISGGQDSTLAGRLCQLACRELREEGNRAEFIAVRLPYAVQVDEDDAKLALAFIEPDRSVVFNIKDAVEGFERELAESLGETMTDFTKGNVKARARMIVQYAIAGQRSLLVVGTDHAAESVTGFFTKYGDGGADVLPLSGLTKRQGSAILKQLGAPERLYTKTPTADLLDHKPAQADETELGLTYDEIDDYLEGRSVNDRVAGAIEALYLRTRHKRSMPITVTDVWWRT